MTHSLDEPRFDAHRSDEENSVSYGDNARDDCTRTPEEDLIRNEDIQLVRDAFLTLSSRERDILCRNTVAGKSGSGESLSDIGKKYGISKERVRQIRNVASEKVRAYLSEA